MLSNVSGTDTMTSKINSKDEKRQNDKSNRNLKKVSYYLLIVHIVSISLGIFSLYLISIKSANIKNLFLVMKNMRLVKNLFCEKAAC